VLPLDADLCRFAGVALPHRDSDAFSDGHFRTWSYNRTRKPPKHFWSIRDSTHSSEEHEHKKEALVLIPAGAVIRVDRTAPPLGRMSRLSGRVPRTAYSPRICANGADRCRRRVLALRTALPRRVSNSTVRL
jgi:hypothetical protein